MCRFFICITALSDLFASKPYHFDGFYVIECTHRLVVKLASSVSYTRAPGDR